MIIKLPVVKLWPQTGVSLLESEIRFVTLKIEEALILPSKQWQRLSKIKMINFKLLKICKFILMNVLWLSLTWYRASFRKALGEFWSVILLANKVLLEHSHMYFFNDFFKSAFVLHWQNQVLEHRYQEWHSNNI